MSQSLLKNLRPLEETAYAQVADRLSEIQQRLVQLQEEESASLDEERKAQEAIQTPAPLDGLSIGELLAPPVAAVAKLRSVAEIRRDIARVRHAEKLQHPIVAKAKGEASKAAAAIANAALLKIAERLSKAMVEALAAAKEAGAILAEFNAAGYVAEDPDDAHIYWEAQAAFERIFVRSTALAAAPRNWDKEKALLESLGLAK